jgi:hypothetical protein
MSAEVLEAPVMSRRKRLFLMKRLWKQTYALLLRMRIGRVELRGPSISVYPEGERVSDNSSTSVFIGQITEFGESGRRVTDPDSTYLSVTAKDINIRTSHEIILKKATAAEIAEQVMVLLDKAREIEKEQVEKEKIKNAFIESVMTELRRRGVTCQKSTTRLGCIDTEIQPDNSVSLKSVSLLVPEYTKNIEFVTKHGYRPFLFKPDTSVERLVDLFTMLIELEKASV